MDIGRIFDVWGKSAEVKPWQQQQEELEAEKKMLRDVQLASTAVDETSTATSTNASNDMWFDAMDSASDEPNINNMDIANNNDRKTSLATRNESTKWMLRPDGKFDCNQDFKVTNLAIVDHKVIQSFKMTSFLGIALADTSLAAHVSLEQFEIGADKSFTFSTADVTQIVDYNGYRDKKWAHFRNVLKNNGLIPVETGKTVIVAFAGLIATLLEEPIQPSRLSITVEKDRETGATFLIKSRNESNEQTSGRYYDRERQERPPRVDNGSINQLLVKNAVTGHNGLLDENEKDFNVVQMTFGDFILIVLSEVDAIDDSNGQQIKIAAKKTFRKIVDLWANAVVSNVSKIVFASVQSVGDPAAGDSASTAKTVSNFSVVDPNPVSIQQELKELKGLSARHRDLAAVFSQDVFLCHQFLDEILTFIVDHANDRKKVVVNIHMYNRNLIYKAIYGQKK